MKLLSRLGAAACALAMGLALMPGMAYAAAGTVTIYYQDGTSMPGVATLAEALVTANASEGSQNPVTRLVLSAGDFDASAENQFCIEKSGLTIEGDANGGTIINCGGFSANGQAGVLIAADGVTLKDVTVNSTAGGGVAAVKVSKIGDGVDPLPMVDGCTIDNVTVSSEGHGLNIHGAQDVSVNALTVTSAGKAGVSLASAVGIDLSNITTTTVAWGDIAIMYSASNPTAYAVPTDVTLSGTNHLAKNLITSERPASATDGRDAITVKYDDGTEWAMTPVADGGWVLSEVSGTQTYAAIDNTEGVRYVTLQDALDLAPSGADIELLAAATGPFAIDRPDAVFSIGGGTGGFGISGGLTVASPLQALTLSGLAFTGAGITSDAGIGALVVENATFTNTAGSAIVLNNQAGSVSIAGTTVKDWAAGDGSGHAIAIAVPDGQNPAIGITGNSFASGSFNADTSESFVLISGAGLTGAIDLTHNYWNGLDPRTAAAAGGVSLAELIPAGSATANVFPYYADEARTDLVDGTDPGPGPDPDPTPKPVPTPTPQPLPTSDPQKLAATGDTMMNGVVAIAAIAVAAGAVLVVFAVRRRNRRNTLPEE